jgi:sorbitol-specific phosphotransferase system component IIBC
MNDVLLWIVGGLGGILAIVIGLFKHTVKTKNMTIEKQKEEIAVNAIEKKTVEELKKATQKQFSDEKKIEQEKQNIVEQVKEAEGKGDTDEAIEIANDIVAGFNSRHKL